jgi:hypothetical protein
LEIYYRGFFTCIHLNSLRAIAQSIKKISKIMGFINSVSHALSKGVQGGSDIIFNGPKGIQLRNELDTLHSEISGQIKKYNDLHNQVSSWKDPLNACGKYTAALLHQSSDFVHGIALNYQQVLSDTSINIENIRKLSDANVVKPLLDLPLPGDFGGFPAALIPGVEPLKMIEGLINVFASSVSLGSKVAEARQNLQKAQNSVRQLGDLLHELEALKDYFLQIANNVLGVFKKTVGLNLPLLTASSAADLAKTVKQMETLVEKLTGTKGNAFMICRFILNLAKKKKINAPTPVQIQWIASTIYQTLDGIQDSFGSQDNVATFVKQYFGADLLIPGILLHIPDPPSNLKKYITESEPTHQEFSDPGSHEFDPPDIDINDFPT